jgi:hypothetical protein
MMEFGGNMTLPKIRRYYLTSISEKLLETKTSSKEFQTVYKILSYRFLGPQNEKRKNL